MTELTANNPRNDDAWIRAQGPLDQLSGQLLRDRVMTAVIQARRQTVLLDLHAVTSIDAAGLQVLIGLRHELEAGGVRLTVAPVESRARAALLAPLMAPAAPAEGVGTPRHAVGDLVEVHTKFDGSWCSGFEIAAVLPHGYRVRRQRDAELLPGPTGEKDVRALR